MSVSSVTINSVDFKMEPCGFIPILAESGWLLENSITIPIQTDEVIIVNHLPAYFNQQNPQ